LFVAWQAICNTYKPFSANVSGSKITTIYDLLFTPLQHKNIAHGLTN